MGYSIYSLSIYRKFKVEEYANNTVGLPSAKSKLWDSLQEKSDFLKIKITRTTGIAKKWRKNLDLQRLKRHFNY